MTLRRVTLSLAQPFSDRSASLSFNARFLSFLPRNSPCPKDFRPLALADMRAAALTLPACPCPRPRPRDSWALIATSSPCHQSRITSSTDPSPSLLSSLLLQRKYTYSSSTSRTLKKLQSKYIAKDAVPPHTSTYSIRRFGRVRSSFVCSRFGQEKRSSCQQDGGWQVCLPREERWRHLSVPYCRFIGCYHDSRCCRHW